MQVTTTIPQTQEPVAMTRLKVGLEELTHQLVHGDQMRIAEASGVSNRTVFRYLTKKEVADFVIGKKILDAGREIVIKREKSLK